MQKLKITYNNSNTAVKYNDFDIEDIVIERIVPSHNGNWDSIDELEGECYDYEVSTENFLIWIRIAVAEKKLDNDKVIIIYQDKEYHLDTNGNYTEPINFGMFQKIPIENIKYK